MRILRHNPDVIALAILGLLLLAPAVAAPHVERNVRAFHLSPASWGELDVSADPYQVEGMSDINDWTNQLERRGERVWQRLSERMRRFEQRFEKLSRVQPRSHSVYCETDSD